MARFGEIAMALAVPPAERRSPHRPRQARRRAATRRRASAADATGPLEARRLKILGHAALNLGQYEEATRLLEEASRATEAAALPRLALEVDVLRGLLLIRTNKQAAGEAVTRAAYQQAVEQNDAYWQAAAANNLGLERMRRFRYDEAIPFLEQALEAADSVRRAAVFSGQPGESRHVLLPDRGFRQGALISGAGGRGSGTDRRAGRPSIEPRRDRQRVLRCRDTPIGLFRSTSARWRWPARAPRGTPRNGPAISPRAHAELKQWDEAEQFNRESLSLRQTGDASSAAYSKLDAAAIAAGRGQHEKAVASTRRRSCWRGQRGAHLGSERRAGRACTATGRAGEGQRFFERCLRTIDAARARLSRSDYKLTFFSRLIHFYQLYVDVLVARRRPREGAAGGRFEPGPAAVGASRSSAAAAARGDPDRPASGRRPG